MVNSMQGMTNAYIGTDTTTVVSDKKGFLHTISINNPGGDLTVYDNTQASGTVLGYFKATLISAMFVVDCQFNNGLTVVSTGTPLATITYHKIG